MSNSKRDETVKLDNLDIQQIGLVKKQIDDELEHLSASFGQLHSAQGKFKECQACLRNRLLSSSDGASVLVPLTNSLYARGQLSDSNHVLVDVGTGFFIEKTMSSAEQFYESKIQDLNKSLRDLEKIVEQKQTQSQALESTLRKKLLSANNSTK